MNIKTPKYWFYSKMAVLGWFFLKKYTNIWDKYSYKAEKATYWSTSQVAIIQEDFYTET